MSPHPPLFHNRNFTADDKRQLDSDGHLMLEGLLTNDACRSLTTSLTAIQLMAENVERDPKPNRYAAEYDSHLASLIGHPHLLDLAAWVLGTPIRFDHCVTLNRSGGNPGQGWHSHGYGEANHQLGFVRIFFYVNGFTANDGGLKVVPGSHLFRDPAIGAASDEDLRSGWLAGKTHPVTGKPLSIHALSAPPGSVILMWTHAAHGVTPRLPDSDTRWTVVYAYRNPGEHSRARWITEEFERSTVPGTDGLMSLY